MSISSPPQTSYGVLRQSHCSSAIEAAAEQVRALGYAALDSGYSAREVDHAGGANTTRDRREVNHVYNIPFYKQQINLPANLSDRRLTPEARYILGFDEFEPASVDMYLAARDRKRQR